MSKLRRITTIEILGQHVWPGVAENNDESVEEMIRQARRDAAHLRAQADLIDATPDADFRIISKNGIYVNRNVTVLQEGRPLTD